MSEAILGGITDCALRFIFCCIQVGLIIERRLETILLENSVKRTVHVTSPISSSGLSSGTSRIGRKETVLFSKALTQTLTYTETEARLTKSRKQLDLTKSSKPSEGPDK